MPTLALYCMHIFLHRKLPVNLGSTNTAVLHRWAAMGVCLVLEYMAIPAVALYRHEHERQLELKSDRGH
jgi:hypothetical protein